MNPAEAVRTPWLPAVTALGLGFIWRLLLVLQSPVAFSFDGFQRWAGRDHVLIQDWPPVTQIVLWLTAQAGGELLAARVVMCLISGLAAAAGTLLAQRLAAAAYGERPALWAGWTFAVASAYAHWAAWGTVFYQESTFLLVLFSGLWLAARGNLRTADLVIGLLGLVRYEGWPCVLLYLAWRRDRRALVALWGALVWAAIRGFGVEGYAASPVNFADWEGLVERFALAAWLADLLELVRRLGEVGGWVWWGLGAVAVSLHWRSSLVKLLALQTLAQLGATMAWVAGLEVVTSRMMVIPVVMVAVLGASAVPALARWPRSGWSLVVALAVLLGFQLVEGRDRMRAETRHFAPEAAAVVEMGRCPGCRWWVLPRRGLGTRARHDGCEVLQGISSLRHGQDFFCSSWVTDDWAEAGAGTDGTVRWDAAAKLYRVERHLPGASPAPAASSPAASLPVAVP